MRSTELRQPEHRLKDEWLRGQLAKLKPLQRLESGAVGLGFLPC